MFVIQLFFEACHALYAIGRNGYFILLSGHLLTVSEKFKVRKRASGLNQRLPSTARMPGFQISNTDKQKMAEKYFCLYCLLVLRNAMQTSCGHFYCQSCLEKLFTDVNDMVMICLQDQQRLLSNESHTSGCEFLKVPCVHPECSTLVKKADLKQHLERYCMYRPQKCEFCAREIPLTNLKLHQERECSLYPVTCNKCSKDGIPRQKLADHQDPVLGDCDGVEGPCPFAQIGCTKTEVLNQREKKEHLQQEHARHTLLLLRTALGLGKDIEAIFRRHPRILSRNSQFLSNYDNLIQDILNQIQYNKEETRNLQGRIQEHSQRITALERKMASENISVGASPCQLLTNSEGSLTHNDITRRLTNVEHKTADHEVLLVESNRTIMETSREVNNVKRQLEGVQDTTRRTERRIESIEHTLALRNVTLADLEEYVRQQEFSSYDGQLLWKITEFTRKRNEAVSGQQVSFYSPHFFTSRYGYKMCARIYLNGDGMGRGTHISVFFVVMRGLYDAILRWPFRQKVTFMLLDQDNVEHVIDAFRPDPSSSSFQRPRRETNIASGCPMFCSLTELNNHAYVKDDTMFLKIIVDTSDL